MPFELIAAAPRTPELREYDEPALGPTDVRIRSEFASPKHGTELVGYRNDPVASKPYDSALGAVVARPVEESLARFPIRLGNMNVGTITEVGSGVDRFKVGDRVFGHMPIRETHTLEQGVIDPMPAGLSDQAALCVDPVVMALPIRDGGIKLGDRVAVFGLGAIGLITIQLAKLAGASQVIALDPIENRRELALKLGADVALDPTADGGDAGMAVRLHGDPAISRPEVREVKRLLGGYMERASQINQLGVDVAIETSGATIALGQAIRATRYGGTICMVSFYGRDASGVYFGDEFHINQLTLISVRAESLPMRGHPAWTLERVVNLGIDWLVKGRIKVDGIITPIVPFAEAANAYRDIDEHPERSIKLGIRFT